MSVAPWFDAYDVEPNLKRELLGGHVIVDGVEREIRDVFRIVAGLDSTGLFLGVDVELDDHRRVTVYNDGSVQDVADDPIGSHELRKPRVTSA